MDIIIHIGHPKTGSDFIQSNLLNNLGENFLGRPYSKEFHNIEKYIVTSNDEMFKKNKFKLIKFFKKKLIEGKKNILSIEDLLKPTFFNKKNGHDIFKSIKRYHSILSNFGNVKVFWIIRSHTEIISSSYDQFYLEDWKNYKITHSQILSFFKKQKNKKKFIFLFESFKYYKNYKNLQKIFGNKKVKFLFYEDLKNKYKFFVKELFVFLKLNKKINIINKILNSSKEKSSYVILVFKIIKFVFRHNILRLLQFKKNYKILIDKLYQIHFRKKNISIFKNEIYKIKEDIKYYYKKDCTRFNDKKIINKMKKYDYI